MTKTKRYTKQLNGFKYKGEPIKITFGTLILICWCILLLIVATFTQITIKHLYLPFDTFSFLSLDPTDTQIVHHFTRTYRYIPQIPVIFFMIAFLGRKFSMITVCLYILLGMFFPIFALGGGISYVLEYGFGYILGFLPVIFFSGTLLKMKSKFLNVLLLATLGVLAIHILGVLYMLFIAALKHAQMDIVSSWIVSQSSIQIAYDIFFSIIAIYIGKLARKVFGIIMC